jgi:hypothetical protein
MVSFMDHLSPEWRQRDTWQVTWQVAWQVAWQVVAKRLEEAAWNGGVEEAAIALRIVLMLEKVPCLGTVRIFV